MHYIKTTALYSTSTFLYSSHELSFPFEILFLHLDSNSPLDFFPKRPIANDSVFVGETTGWENGIKPLSEPMMSKFSDI